MKGDLELSLRLHVLSDKLWGKLREKFPEKSILFEVVKVVEELGELADLALRLYRRQRQQKRISERELKAKMKEEISDVIITLVIIAKDLDIDIWKALEERMLEEIERPL